MIGVRRKEDNLKARARLHNGEWIEGYYLGNDDILPSEVSYFDETEKIDPSTLVFPEVEELKKQNAELLERLKQFRQRIYQQSFSNMQLREMADCLIAIQQAERVRVKKVKQ